MNNYFKSSDGKEIFFHEWLIENPKGTIQIIHGMAEHGKRYKHFARFLNEKGYVVFATDHRGHGLSKNEKDLFGNIGKDGFEMMVEDEILFAKKIKKKYKLPHFIIGHSMGSFISQRILQKEKNLVDGVILSGSTTGIENMAKLGKILSKTLMLITGVRISNLLDKLAFYGYNEKTSKRTSFDWLNRNKAEVDKYINDGFCGFIPPNIFYYYLFDALTKLWKNENMEKISKDTKLFIISGDMDPVGNYGKGVEDLYKLYNNYGINSVKMKLYPGGRHEMLNEENKEEVYMDIYKWIKNI